MLIYSTTKIKRKSERLRKWRKIIVNKDFKRNVVIAGKNNYKYIFHVNKNKMLSLYIFNYRCGLVIFLCIFLLG